MRLHEFEAKALFGEFGIPVPRGMVASQPEQAIHAAAALEGEVMVKAQVLAGGRGLAGGIRLASSPEVAGDLASQVLAGQVRGCRPRCVLVEERLDIARELYLGVVVDSAAGRPAVLVSAAGGMDIERVAATRPEAIASMTVSPLEGLSETQARHLVAAAGIGEEALAGAAAILGQLYQLFEACEALIAEINPLVVKPDGSLVAADAVIELDDSALFRHPRWLGREGEEAEGPVRRFRDKGMTFVELEGEIGLICSGAGLGMATMDLIAERARPANFLETGGGITRELMAAAMHLVLSRPGLKGILINVYGGINPIHEGALGVADVMAGGVSVPVVAKALGHFQEQTWAILEQAGVTVVRELETEQAVAEILRQTGG